MSDREQMSTSKSQPDAEPSASEATNEAPTEDWGSGSLGLPALTLEEQLSIERERRQRIKEKEAEGPSLGFSLERDPDPRESDEWFSKMDETTQSEVKGEWRLQAWLSDAVSVAWQDRRKQAYIDAVVIFVLSQTVFDPFRFSILKVIAVLPVAALVGLLWGHFKMGRFQSVLVGYPILLTFQLMTGLAPQSGMAHALTFFYGALAFCALAGMAGTVRESAT